MGMLAIVNMLLLLVGFLMRLLKQKRAMASQPQPSLAVEQFTQAQKG
jgi:hypothetical protein